MYESHVNGTTNRLPKGAASMGSTPAASSSLGRAVGTALVQAAAIVVVAKVVDAVLESFLARRRQQQQTQQQRHPEHAHA